MPLPIADTVIVHYGEIALKLGHRPMFERRLLENLRMALRGLPVGSVRAVYGRMLVDLGRADAVEVARRLALVAGVANVLIAGRCEPTMDRLQSYVRDALQGWRPRGSFRVRVKRGDKSFPLVSPEIARRLGAEVVEATGAPVDLGRADETVYVEIIPEGAFVAFQRVEGCGGLPVGSSGRVLLLLSGGIDSPVAGLRVMRRGCRLDAVHFHSVPYLDRTSQDKARKLCSVLARGHRPIALHMVAFGEAQREVVRCVPRPLRVVLYRRLMMRIACAVAARTAAGALVTGESLGQVASQTLANLGVIEAASRLPVLRPLVAADKLEIIDYAKTIGTYEISIVPDQDCCTLFVPKHPATAATLEETEVAESLLDGERLVEDAVRRVDVETIAGDWNEVHA